MDILTIKDFSELWELLFKFASTKRERITSLDFIPFINTKNEKKKALWEKVVSAILAPVGYEKERDFICDGLAKVLCSKFLDNDKKNFSEFIVSSFPCLIYIKKITGLDLISKISSYLSDFQRKILYEFIVLFLKKKHNFIERITNPVEKFSSILSSEGNGMKIDEMQIDYLLNIIQKGIEYDETLFIKLVTEINNPDFLKKLSSIPFSEEKIINFEILLNDTQFQILPVILTSCVLSNFGENYWSKIISILSSLPPKDALKIIAKLFFILHTNEQTRYSRLNASCLSISLLKLEMGMNGYKRIELKNLISEEFYSYFLLSNLISAFSKKFRDVLKEWLIETCAKFLKGEVEIPSYLPDALIWDLIVYSFRHIFFDGYDINESERKFYKLLSSVEAYFHSHLFQNNMAQISLKRRFKIFYHINLKLLQQKNKRGKYPFIIRSAEDTVSRLSSYSLS